MRRGGTAADAVPARPAGLGAGAAGSAPRSRAACAASTAGCGCGAASASCASAVAWPKADAGSVGGTRSGGGGHKSRSPSRRAAGAWPVCAWPSRSAAAVGGGAEASGRVGSTAWAGHPGAASVSITSAGPATAWPLKRDRHPRGRPDHAGAALKVGGPRRPGRPGAADVGIPRDQTIEEVRHGRTAPGNGGGETG